MTARRRVSLWFRCQQQGGGCHRWRSCWFLSSLAVVLSMDGTAGAPSLAVVLSMSAAGAAVSSLAVVLSMDGAAVSLHRWRFLVPVIVGGCQDQQQGRGHNPRPARAAGRHEPLQCGGGLASVTEASGFCFKSEAFVFQQVSGGGRHRQKVPKAEDS